MVTAAATATTATQTAASAVPQVVGALNTIVHTMPGFYGTALAGMYLVNRPTSTTGHVVNFAAAAAITYGLNVVAPHFFLANAFSGATNTAANIPGSHDPFRHLLDPIAKAESGNKFVYGGGAPAPPDITLDQHFKFGKAPLGRWQIMPKNRIGFEMGLPGSANFKANEFAMAKGLAIKRGAMKVAAGKMSIPEYIKRGLSNEFCVVPTGPEGFASDACRAAGNPAKAAMPYSEIFNGLMQFKRHYPAPGTAFATMAPGLN